MRMKLTWIVATLVLLSIGLLLACGTKYSASSNGLLVVPSQGQGIMESFSIDLGNGHVSEINNVNGPTTNGLPSQVILNPAGTVAYVITTVNPAISGGPTGIQVFPIVSDGKMATGTSQALNNENATIVSGGSNVPESVPVSPVALAMDSAGQFLFVADSVTSDSSGNAIPGAISVLSISSSGSLTEVPNSPFVLPVSDSYVSPPLPCQLPSTVGPPPAPCPSASALAVTPTIFPQLYASCSTETPPTTEDLFVADAANYQLLNYSVNTSTGALTLVPYSSTLPGISTGTDPDGVAIDPCDRFAYVANAQDNNVGAYSMCSVVAIANNCTTPNYALTEIKGSPYPTSPGDNPGPMSVDAYGNFVYVVSTESGAGGVISGFRISSTTGALTPTVPAYFATGSGPNSIAVRSDDSWLFVANFYSTEVTQYAIVPATGALTPIEPPIDTYDYPSGVAVH
jgi:hypothetical protein